MVDAINYDVKECMRDLFPECRWGLLTILMLFANPQRRCWPSIDGLAHLMHTSQRKVTKARDWLVEHGALSIVPYDKRVGEESKLSPRQLVYQLTGAVVIDGKSYAYLYADVSGGGNIKVSNRKNTAVKNTDAGNGTKNQNSSEVEPIEVKESQSVSLRSTDCTPAPQPPLTVQVFGALPDTGPESGMLAETPVTAAVEAAGPEPSPSFAAPLPAKSGEWQVWNQETGELAGEFTDRPSAVHQQKALNSIGGAKYTIRRVAPEKPPRQPPQYGALVAALVAAAWGIPIKNAPKATKERAGEAVKLMLADFPDTTADHLLAFVRWYRSENPKANLPRDKNKIADWFGVYRAKRAPRDGSVYLNDDYFKRRNETA